MKIAAVNKIPFLTTGGGHGTDDFHAFNGLSIDLSNFRSVHLDPSENSFTIGGSAKIYQLDKLLNDAGKEFRMSSYMCRQMGLVGLTTCSAGLV